MHQEQIKVKDFEFYYLAELTRKKIKPLSRFEKNVNKKSLQWLKKQGFFVDIIPRKTLSGTQIAETIFSTSSRYIDFYRCRFNNTLLRKDRNEKRLEGFLFGYPSCCVHQFIERPYIANHLSESDQSLLFHWACPDCCITRELIPYYKPIYDSIEEWIDSEIKISQSANVYSKNYRRKLQTAVAAALLSTGLLSAQTPADTTHFIPLPGDINNNGLSYAEEIYLGTYEDGILNDCQEYAKLFKIIIDSLPDSVCTNKTYKIDNLMRGVIQCQACGNWINMGFVTIVNPLRNLEMELPYMALHYMENGYFSYGGNDTFNRVEIDTLKSILFPYDPEHMIPVENDLDGDGLSYVDEDSLWLAYTAEESDFDNDGIMDGPQIAEELIRLFPKLKESSDGIHSHVKYNLVYGIENCQICGSTHNMGTVEIFNPENNRHYEIPYLALHSMAHGCFSYDGDVHSNERVDVIKLIRAMKTHMLFISADTDDDGLTDEEEAYFGFAPEKMDSDNDGISDGKKLAITFADSIKLLPTEPKTSQSYIEYLDMDGVQLCSVCGQDIPMGIIKIYNPLINTIDPMEISYYAFHFLECGSFAYEGADQGRIDPIKLAEYMNNLPTDIDRENNNKIPASFILEQNYPNPFNSSTSIRYILDKESLIELTVFNLLGEKIATIYNGKQNMGVHTISFNAEGLPSGIYIYQLISADHTISKKMILTK